MNRLFSPAFTLAIVCLLVSMTTIAVAKPSPADDDSLDSGKASTIQAETIVESGNDEENPEADDEATDFENGEEMYDEEVTGRIENELATRATTYNCKCEGTAPCKDTSRKCKVLSRCMNQTSAEYKAAKQANCLCGARAGQPVVCKNGLYCVKKPFCVKPPPPPSGGKKEEGADCTINKNECKAGLFCYKYADGSTTCSYTCNKSEAEQGGCGTGYICMMDLEDDAHNNGRGSCFNGQ